MQPRFRPYGWVRPLTLKGLVSIDLSDQLGIIKGAKIHVDFATLP